MANLARVLELAQEHHGDAVAYGGLTDGLTYTQLYRSAVRIASRLIEAGSKRAVIAEPNSPLIPAAIFGAALAGATYAPLNYRLPGATRRQLLERLGPAVVITPEWLDPAESGAMPYAQASDGTEEVNPAAIVFTSGTSAAPKAVVFEHEHLLRAALREPQLSAGPDQAALLTAPPFHLPNILILLSAIHTGRRLVPYAPHHFSAQHWLEMVKTERITQAVLVPTMLQRIVDHLERTGEEPPPLARLGYGSARIPQPVLTKALKLFPDTTFSNSYGSTESTGAIAVLNDHDHRSFAASRDPVLARRLQSAGKPLPGIEIRIADADYSPLPASNQGQILVRGPQISGRYLDTSSAMVTDDWLATGDQGWIDNDGYLYCSGRGDDTLIIGGENVAAAEIEDVLINHPAIAEAVVIGIEDTEWGEIPAAVITLKGADITALPDDLSEWSVQHLGSLKRPRHFYIVEELPQTPTGKVIRRQVRQHVLAQLRDEF